FNPIIERMNVPSSAIGIVSHTPSVPIHLGRRNKNNRTRTNPLDKEIIKEPRTLSFDCLKEASTIFTPIKRNERKYKCMPLLVISAIGPGSDTNSLIKGSAYK